MKLIKRIISLVNYMKITEIKILIILVFKKYLKILIKIILNHLIYNYLIQIGNKIFIKLF
jgi:hypothetical protein